MIILEIKMAEKHALPGNLKLHLRYQLYLGC